MPSSIPGADLAPAIEQVLGYLNFSSGAGDPQMLRSLNALFTWAESRPDPWRDVLAALRAQLQCLRQSQQAFADSRQAEAALQAAERTLTAYREFHRDLLFHQEDRRLFNAFFVGRVFEAVLRSEPLSHSPDQCAQLAVAGLNDFIGHRPVPTLESQRIEPYAHELVRPVPLYIREVGVCCGPHREVVEAAIELLQATPANLLRQAHFDPELMDELAIDPRAYDFDHPVNKRPNYHFGQWDPHQIDGQGRYRRFVVQQVTLDSLMCRVGQSRQGAPEELQWEAAAVLAGTILMAAGVSGWGPGAHTSRVTLASLLPMIAAYRDEFYEQLLARMKGPHQKRLQAEAAERRQPFGGARQHLNSELGRRRAKQMQHVQLAKIFAAMGHLDASQRQVEVVAVPSARMACRIECLLSEGLQSARDGRLNRSVDVLAEVRDLLVRAIECGALADPWSVLGFDANFSLFPALENSVHDHRVDELVDLVDRVFQLHSRVWSEAAALDQQRCCHEVDRTFQSLALWWRQFAIHQVSSVDCEDSQLAYEASRHVAEALNQWHKDGAAAGDIAFWAPHAENFDSPKAYVLVIERLLERSDVVAAMALMVHWLSQAECVQLEQGDCSFHRCAMQCLRAIRRQSEHPWRLTAKFLNSIEANAGPLGVVPRLERPGAPEEEEEPADGDDNRELFGAAYEGVVYRDSADDGIDGSLAGQRSPRGAGAPGEDDLAAESDRISCGLDFFATLARLWRIAALPVDQQVCDGGVDYEAQLRQWIRQSGRARSRLSELLRAVASHEIPSPLGDHDSMVEYDRRRLVKESLLEQVMAAYVEVANASRLLTAVLRARIGGDSAPELPSDWPPSEEEIAAADAMAPLLTMDAEAARPRFQRLLELIQDQPLLYIPLSKGGDPEAIVAARVRQHCLRDLLKLLPRAGLLTEVGQLLETAREMERCQPAGAGAVTEFDELFTTGYRALVECLVRSTQTWEEGEDPASKRPAMLVACLEQLTESVLISWLTHSRTLRLSVLEKVSDEAQWGRLVCFIKTYGAELFTQQFLNLANVRAILHCGVDHWLRQLQADMPDELKLLRDLDHSLSFDDAVEFLSVVLEAMIENYSEYRDYNSTTTLSDNGSMLYSLLDFLRLRARYDRVCWHLRPVVLAHEILVRRQQEAAAKLWRRALSERIHDESSRYLERLAELQQKYAMRLPTVADRLGERFTKPLAVDRMLALVEPAVREAEQGGRRPTFELLEHETESLSREPTGVGLDVPDWLAALEDEVERLRRPEFEQELSADELGLPAVQLSLDEVTDQLDRWGDEEDD